MLKYLLGSATALALLSSPAAAATFTVSTGTNNLALIPANDFKDELELLGLNTLRQPAMLTLNGPAKIKVELFGSESGAQDRLTILGALEGAFQYTQGPDVGFGPVLLANLTFTNAAAFDISFSSSLSTFGTIHRPGDGEFGYFFNGDDDDSDDAFTTNVLWLGYDNQLTATDDDNHDDLVIRLTATAVPEPATWAMMIGGFGLVGAASRRRIKTVTYA